MRLRLFDLVLAVAVALLLFGCTYATGPAPRRPRCDSAVVRDTATGRVLGKVKTCQ